MQRRSIGGIEVAPLGLGTARLASLGARRSTRDAARLLDVAADLGVTFIDTADTYGSTACERRLGEVMRGRTSRFVVATKSGLTTVDLPGALRPLNQPAKKAMQLIGRRLHLEPGQLKRSIDASLRRLRRERIEFYFLHSPPLGVEKRDDLFAVLDDAQRAGKIGVYGISSAETEVVAAAAAVRHCHVAQTMVNPLTTDAVRTIQRRASDSSPIELIANHALMGPLLMSPLPPKGAPPAVAELARKLEATAARSGVSRASLLVRHAAAVPNVKVVRVGTSNPEHLAENVAALDRPSTGDDLLA